MKKVLAVFIVALVVLALDAGWQIGNSMLKATELQDDMKDMASQVSVRSGYARPQSDSELRESVVHKASAYGFKVKPDQVAVGRSGEGLNMKIYLAAHFENPIELPGFAFQLHFNLESGPKP